MATIPEGFQDIFRKPAFAALATVDADGTPQVTPVWIDYDGSYVLVNSAAGRKKDRNLRERPQVSISVTDPENPYRYVGLQGRVVEITTAGAVDHINQLAHRYLGRDYPYLTPSEQRVIYKIEPHRVWTMG